MTSRYLHNILNIVMMSTAWHVWFISWSVMYVAHIGLPWRYAICCSDCVGVKFGCHRKLNALCYQSYNTNLWRLLIFCCYQNANLNDFIPRHLRQKSLIDVSVLSHYIILLYLKIVKRKLQIRQISHKTHNIHFSFGPVTCLAMSL